MAKAKHLTSTDEFRALVARLRDTPSSVAMDLRVQLAAIITRELRENGWTQAELARRAAMPQSTVSEIMHADVNCTFETVGRLLFALGIRGRLSRLSAEPPPFVVGLGADTTADTGSAFTAIKDKTDGQENRWFVKEEDSKQEKGRGDYWFLPAHTTLQKR